MQYQDMYVFICEREIDDTQHWHAVTGLFKCVCKRDRKQCTCMK